MKVKHYRILIVAVLLGVNHVAFCQLGLPGYQQANLTRVYEFNVILKNDSSFKTMSKILFDNGGKTYVSAKMLADKNEIYPSDTDFIFGKIGADTWLKGVPADSCWLFKCDEGKINSYSFVPEQGTNLIIAIQKGEDGPILPLTKDNLLSLMADDPKALKLAERNKLTNAIFQYNHPPVVLGQQRQ